MRIELLRINVKHWAVRNDLGYMMADQVTKYVGVLSTKEIKVGSQERGQQVSLAVRMECVAFGLKCTHNRYNFHTSLSYMHVRIF